ncbi:hypothetical protein XA3_21470 [Xylocopilactobacillus apicola]|uniref:Uncharacterized protein n=1 Tax=Xylocopilactobacillus apicola TaxID=2932184 RepID=A0AAU9D4C4_9LACO|nr:hypothetical protein XA3_21470 [Xylocopilactobacillus apicola]
MIHYRKILELYAQGIVHREIAAIIGNSRPKIAEVIKQAELHQIGPPFKDEITDLWLESLLFPQKHPKAKGRQVPNFEQMHNELAKPNVTLSLPTMSMNKNAVRTIKFLMLTGLTVSITVLMHKSAKLQCEFITSLE